MFLIVVPAPTSGSGIQFTVDYNGANAAVTYVAITLNNSYAYTITTPYHNTPNYAQYIVEAPFTDQSGYLIQSQIAEFGLNVTFESPIILTGSGYINLNGLIGSADYNEYIMNQTRGTVNQNIEDDIGLENGYNVPIMVWVNSNYNLGGI